MSDPPPMLQYKSPAPGIITKERTSACRLLKVLGGSCIVVGMYPVAVLISLISAGFDGFFTDIMLPFGASGLLALGVGVTYWECASKILQFSKTALIVAMVVSGIHLAVMTLVLFVGIVEIAEEPPAVLLVIFSLLFVAGLVPLLGHLAKLRREVI